MLCVKKKKKKIVDNKKKTLVEKYNLMVFTISPLSNIALLSKQY